MSTKVFCDRCGEVTYEPGRDEADMGSISLNFHGKDGASPRRILDLCLPCAHVVADDGFTEGFLGFALGRKLFKSVGLRLPAWFFKRAPETAEYLR